MWHVYAYWMLSFDVFFDLHLNKPLSKQSWGWWSGMSLCSLWHHCNEQGKSEGFDSCDRPSNLAQIGFKSSIFRLCYLEIWRMTLKNNRALLLCYFELYTSFRSHWWIETGVTAWKWPIWVKMDDFLSHVTLQFDVWPWKTIGHLFYSTSSFVHHFIAIGESKL